MRRLVSSHRSSRRRLGGRAAASGLLVLALSGMAACGSESDTGGTSATDAPDATDAPVDDAADTADGEASDTASDAPVGAPDLSGEAICNAVPAEAVAAATGLEITGASPSDDGTPQCSYPFTGSDGVSTNAIVAVQRTDADLGGLIGAEAYDFVVNLNRSMGGDSLVETPLDGYERGIVLSGTSLQFGVVEIDGRIITTILGTEGGDTAAAVALTLAAADALRP